MSNKLTDNGTLLTLGLVGAVAAVGAVRTRGSRSFSDMTPSEELEGLHRDIISAWTSYADPAAVADGRLSRLALKAAKDFMSEYGYIESLDEYEDTFWAFETREHKKYSKTHKWLRKPNKPMKITRPKGAAPAKKVAKSIIDAVGKEAADQMLYDMDHGSSSERKLAYEMFERLVREANGTMMDEGDISSELISLIG